MLGSGVLDEEARPEVSARPGLPRTAAGNLIRGGARKEALHPPPVLTSRAWPCPWPGPRHRRQGAN